MRIGCCVVYALACRVVTTTPQLRTSQSKAFRLCYGLENFMEGAVVCGNIFISFGVKLNM